MNAHASQTNGKAPRIVVVGGGTAGITVAARLRKRLDHPNLTIIEPSRKHYYQPLWTLVGGGLFPREESEREEADFIPDGARWLLDAVEEFRPDANLVVTREGSQVPYDYLVVAPGIQLNWGGIRGLNEALGHDGVCSNYSYNHVSYTWDCIRNFRGGEAVFTMPATPVKCGGAPQKIMYLADDTFRGLGVRDRSQITYATAMDCMFAVPRYCKTLDAVVARKSIQTRFSHNLVEVRTSPAREADFEIAGGGSVTLPFDMIHVTPPMGPPDIIKRSPLANPDGWVDVDRDTLQHVRYPNVFGIGDASSLPTSKTGAAIRKQAPVLVANLVAVMHGQKPNARYDGYTSCPLVTGYGKLVLAEFDYEKRPAETFPVDQSKERRSMYLLKKYGLPYLYWNKMLRGKM